MSESYYESYVTITFPHTSSILHIAPAPVCPPYAALESDRNMAHLQLPALLTGNNTLFRTFNLQREKSHSFNAKVTFTLIRIFGLFWIKNDSPRLPTVNCTYSTIICNWLQNLLNVDLFSVVLLKISNYLTYLKRIIKLTIGI